MSDYILWVDTTKAHVFEINSESKVGQIKKHEFEHRKKLNKNGHDHNVNEELFKDIADHIHNCKKLLVMGPGVAKTQFRSFLDRSYAHSLAKNVVGVETCDHPTENQILAIARKFFVHYDLFNDPVIAGHSRN